jgi:hypothetical protein
LHEGEPARAGTASRGDGIVGARFGYEGVGERAWQDRMVGGFEIELCVWVCAEMCLQGSLEEHAPSADVRSFCSVRFVSVCSRFVAFRFDAFRFTFLVSFLKLPA